MGRVSATEPTPPPPHVESQGPGLCDTRQHRSPPLRMAEVRSHKTHGNTGALPVLEGGVQSLRTRGYAGMRWPWSGAVGRVATCGRMLCPLS
jgi:hypothetical protein